MLYQHSSNRDCAYAYMPFKKKKCVEKFSNILKEILIMDKKDVIFNENLMIKNSAYFFFVANSSVHTKNVLSFKKTSTFFHIRIDKISLKRIRKKVNEKIPHFATLKTVTRCSFLGEEIANLKVFSAKAF